MNFGTMVDGHNDWRISKISEWQILVTHLNNNGPKCREIDGNSKKRV